MIINGIDTKDISIVVQGAIDRSCTSECLRQLRSTFPGAEIVLSTWEGSAVDGLDYDILVTNKDPGGMKRGPVFDNTNRQIVSTKNGLAQCSKTYALKIRSDCFVKSNRMLLYWDRYPKRNENYTWFQHRVILPTLYTKRVLDQNSLIPMPFHYSDWLQFGLRADLNRIWNVDLIEDPSYTEEFSEESYHGVKLKRRWIDSRLVAESYIFSSAAKKVFPQVQYSSMCEYSSENIEFSENLLINNFILVDPKNLGIEIRKEPYLWHINNIDKFRKGQPDCLYTEDLFAELYERS